MDEIGHVLQPPYSIGFCLGVDWALPAEAETLFFMKTMLPEKEVPWGVIHNDMNDFAMLATAIGLGASFVRVGFEDSPFFAPGKAAKSNADLVERMVSLIHQIGYEVAICDEAREMLGVRK